MNPVRDLKLALDPLAFCEAVGITPDPWQAEVLAGGPAGGAHRRQLLCCARQSGKSLITAVMALREACGYGEAAGAGDAPPLVVVGAPSLRQSAELVRTIKGLHARLEGAPRIALESITRLEFEGGARIIALPASERTVRGLAGVHLVILDECARIADDLIASIRPMQATVKDARMLALSTPAGKRGKFYEWWTSGEDWHRTRITADECPRITREFLEAERRELGDLLYRQEYCVEFVDSGEQLLPTILLEMAISKDVPALRLLS